MSTVMEILRQNNRNVDKLVQEIDDIIIKVLISIHPILKRNHSSLFLRHEFSSACFELLGFDILLDRELRPYLLEVNHSPSFATDSLLDKEVKESLLYDALKMINFHETDKRKCLDQQRRTIAQRLVVPKSTAKLKSSASLKQKSSDMERKRREYNDEQAKFETENIGRFRLIYPSSKMQYYEKFYNSQPLVYQETKASKSRAESARLLRESLLQKQDQKMPEMGESPFHPSPLNSDPVPLDTGTPTPIVAEEEKKRVNELMRRHARLRMYGVIAAVHNFFAFMEETSPLPKVLLI